MDLDARIKYWQGRARVARQAGCEAESAAAGKVVGLLREALVFQRRVDRKIDAIVDDMPEERYGVS